MTTRWLTGAHVADYSGFKGNGPFGNNGSFLGVVLHVNVAENGTSDSFFKARPPTNPDDVCPNFQVYKSAASGGIHQYLPFNWQPWCQADGNYHYAAIETAGMPDEPLTQYQLEAIASILAVYHDEMGMPLQLANSAGQPGFGIHSMGGQAWGGHTCPGTIRANQRQAILDLVEGDSMAGITLDDIRQIVREELHKTLTGDDGAPHQVRTIVDQEVKPYLDAQTVDLKQHVTAMTGTIIHGDDNHPHSLDSIAKKLGIQ